MTFCINRVELGKLDRPPACRMQSALRVPSPLPTKWLHARGAGPPADALSARPAPSAPPTQVHLVSEHIWCEDFLVRSFYLKNLQTNETRTVTQFHFLSWYDQGVPSSTRSLLDFRR